MKKHYETHVEDTDKLISVAGPELDYKSWYEQYRKLMEEQAQRKYGLYTPTSEGNVGEFTDNKGVLFVASNGTNYAQIAFKNLGIYDNHILSKDDCIKAYNYLQTLKAK